MMLPNFKYQVIDRDARNRSNRSLIEKFYQGPDSRLLIWFKDELIVRQDRDLYFLYEQMRSFSNLFSEPIYLGTHQQQHFFTCQLDQWHPGLDNYERVKLRSISRTTSGHHLSLLFHARGLLNWHQNHAFCSGCGSSMAISSGGHARTCNNADCGKTHYPKIDPAVIFSIVNNTGPESKMLLGRQPHWDEYRYSVIAGFVEPGESLEDAVKREALEETGLVVESVEYIASQSWPFPDSLMMGFHCETQQHQITLVDQELEVAAWFSTDELEQQVKSGALKLPFPLSISWYLVERWYTQQTGRSLMDIEK